MINDTTKDVYQTWFSYLIRTKSFQQTLEYMRSGKPLKGSPYADFSAGYNRWVYHLLPNIWKHDPTDESFEAIWSAWQRRQVTERGEAVLDFPWEKLQETISHYITQSIELYNEDHGSLPCQEDLAQIIKEDTESSINLFCYGNRIALWIDPAGDRYERVIDNIKHKVSERREHMAEQGINFSNSTEGRYNAPVANSRDHLFKEDGRTLARLKRQLNILVLRESGLSVNAIASGCFNEDILPFDLVVFSSNAFGNSIVDQQSIRKESGDYDHILPSSEITKEVKDFIYADYKAAKKTVDAVETGWFPTLPS